MGRYIVRGNTEHGWRNEHVAIVEEVLGRRLRGTECVHHADGNSQDNAKENLVVCPDQAYHKLLHTRLEAFKETGDPDKRKCVRCGEYDSIFYMALHARRSTSYIHPECRREADNARYHARKATGYVKR